MKPHGIDTVLAQLEPDMSPRTQVNFMFDVLSAIADGSLADPVGTAATVVGALKKDGLFAPGGRFYREDLDQVVDVFSHAEEMAKTFKIDPKVLDFLFAHRRDRAMPRDIWEKEVRIAYCAEQLLPQLPRYTFETLVDPDARSVATETLRVSGGMVLLVFHGSFLQTSRKMFPLIYPAGMGEGILVAGEGRLRSKDGVLRAGADPRKALFVALKAVLGGEIVYIGPDGPTGRQSGTLNVLGVHRSAGEGAAFLAHSCKCATGWYAVRRVGNRLVPVIEPGPRAIDGESFGEFQDRLYKFYVEKIEEVLTGDPHNIAVRGRWAQVFAAAQSAKA